MVIIGPSNITYVQHFYQGSTIKKKILIAEKQLLSWLGKEKFEGSQGEINANVQELLGEPVDVVIDQTRSCGRVRR